MLHLTEKQVCSLYACSNGEFSSYRHHLLTGLTPAESSMLMCTHCVLLFLLCQGTSASTDRHVTATLLMAKVARAIFTCSCVHVNASLPILDFSSEPFQSAFPVSLSSEPFQR